MKKERKRSERDPLLVLRCQAASQLEEASQPGPARCSAPLAPISTSTFRPWRWTAASKGHGCPSRNHQAHPLPNWTASSSVGSQRLRPKGLLTPSPAIPRPPSPSENLHGRKDSAQELENGLWIPAPLNLSCVCEMGLVTPTEEGPQEEDRSQPL